MAAFTSQYISIVTGFIADVLLVLISICNAAYNKWNKAENEAEWPHFISVIDSQGVC